MLEKAKRHFTDMRYGYTMLAPIITYSNFILIAYNFTGARDALPFWLFGMVFTVAVILGLVSTGKVFRKKQLSTDEDLRYAQNREQARTNTAILEGIRELLDTEPNGAEQKIRERLDYLKKISG